MAKRKKVDDAEADAGRVTSYRSRAIRKLGADIFFACDHPLIGTVLPGRGGGRITGCVTPSEQHPRELQLNVGLPNVGKPFRLSTVRDRLRGKTMLREPKTATEERKLATIEAVGAFLRDGIPAPVGRVYPGRAGSSRCDREHPVWQGYDEALEEAASEAAVRFDDPEEVSEKEYRAELRAEFKRSDPERFTLWDAVTRSCVETYEKTFPRAKGYESPQAEVARRRAAYVLAGGDVGAGDWTDQLADATKAKKRASAKGKRASSKKRSSSKGAR